MNVSLHLVNGAVLSGTVAAVGTVPCLSLDTLTDLLHEERWVHVVSGSVGASPHLVAVAHIASVQIND